MKDLSFNIQPIDLKTYSEIFNLIGGSFSCHPRVLNLISNLSKNSLILHGIFKDNQCIGAVPMWEDTILANQDVLRQFDAYKYIDIGQSALRLPLNRSYKFFIEQQATFVSHNHYGQINNMEINQAFNLCFAKGINLGKNLISNKANYNRLREIQKIEEVGGKFKPIHEITPSLFIQYYSDLFKKRWGRVPHAFEYFQIVINELWDMLSGDLLIINDSPVAIHIAL
jgi:hypothetical protein